MFLVLSILTMTKIKPCDSPNLAFLLTYDLILWLLLAATYCIPSPALTYEHCTER